MPPTISITTSKDAQLKAAGVLSDTLRNLGSPHAYIGGFAWALLGSQRATEMSTAQYYVLIEVKSHNILEIRQKLSEVSKQFAAAGLKFYFVQEIRRDLSGDELVRASKDNVLIETLQAGTLGLPSVAGPVYDYTDEPSGAVLSLLHPGVLILTKMKRWAANSNSTRPKTVQKNLSDLNDLRYLVHWLAHNEMTIDFDGYVGKPKEELLQFVRLFRARWIEDTVFLKTLRRVIKPNDWDSLQFTVK